MQLFQEGPQVDFFSVLSAIFSKKKKKFKCDFFPKQGYFFQEGSQVDFLQKGVSSTIFSNHALKRNFLQERSQERFR